MNMTRLAFILLFTVMLNSACINLENANPSNRRTFFKYFEGPYNLAASALELTPTGYVILGNINVNTTDTSFVQAVLLNIQPDGTLSEGIHYYPGGSGKSFKPVYNGTSLLGFIIVGDSLFIDPFAEQAGNVEIYSMRILQVDANFNAIGNLYISDTVATGNQIRVDFTGESVAVSGDGKIAILGTRKINPTAPSEPFLVGISADLRFSWYMPYTLVPGRTCINGRTLHYIHNKIFWTRSVSEVQGPFINSWVSLPVVQEGATFINDSPLGEFWQGGQYFLSNDITTANNPDFGFAITGTYSKSTDGSKGNIFFAQAHSNGSFIERSVRFFDLVLSANGNALADSTQSVIVDEGNAITSTSDGGFVIAGTITTVPSVLGKGGKDLVLLKLSAAGNLIWYRLLGGTGDDVPVAIKETDSGDLLIAGTHTLGNYSAIFLVRTDRNGELKN